jgi:hypothetical protein
MKINRCKENMKQKFKAYCHLRNKIISEPMECSEISFLASPEILRQIADFLINAAQKIENASSPDELHFHIQDEYKSWANDLPDLIVVPMPK